LAPGQSKNKSLKEAFVEGMNNAQSTTIRTLSNDIFVDFENPGLVNFLIERTVFSPADVSNDAHLLAENERAQVCKNIQEAKSLIAKVDPNLHRLITTLIGSVAVYRIAQRDGGSVSCGIGLIWISPKQDWTLEYYAEMLVHEFVHNSVFLEDMIHGIMPNPELLEHEEALTTSVIRKTRRPFDKAFHSACVAAAIMYFYHSMGNESEAGSYVSSMRRTIEELYQNDMRLHKNGLELLSDNGRQIVSELQRFIEGPNYDMIAKALGHW
jgi:HEXXH motif-containing protein